MDDIKRVVMNRAVEISCLKHKYEDGTKIEICDSHFFADQGEIVIIIGPNGSGKSTLLHHIIGFLEPTEGEVKLFGVNVFSKEFESLRKDIGIVFQNVDDQLIAPTVYDDIAFSPLNYGWDKKKIDPAVNDIMKKLRIENLKDKAPHYLSGGEKKKVALAGALIMNPKLLVLDELFANMDTKSKDEITDYLINLNKKHKTTIVMTSHEDEIIRKFKARIFSLH